MEHIDNGILNLLKRDYRISLNQLAKRLTTTPVTIRRRIRRLEQKQQITYTVHLNPLQLGIQRTFFLFLKTNPREPNIAQRLEELRECQTLYGVTGTYSLLAKLRTTTPIHFKGLLDKIDQLVTMSIFKQYRLIDLIHTYKENHTLYPLDVLPSQSHPDLDPLDLQMLQHLQNQGNKKITNTKLAKLLRRPQPTVHKRVQQLIEKGIIQHYTIHTPLNPNRLQTLLEIKAQPNNIDRLGLELVKNPQIDSLYRTSENYNLLAIVNTENTPAYNQFLLRLYKHPDILDTNTMLILQTRKNVALLKVHPFV